MTQSARNALGTLAVLSAVLSLLSGCNDSAPPGPSESDLTEGLVAHWALNEGTGSEAADSLGSASSGEIHGAVWTAGPTGYALEFDGVNDYVEIASLQLVGSLGEGSIALWFRVDHIPTDNGIAPIFYYGARRSCVNMFDAANQGLIVELGHSPIHYGSERLYFTIFANGCSYPSFCYDSRDAVSVGEWHHFVAVVGGDYNTGYLDGAEMTERRYNFGNASYSQFFEDAVQHEVLWIGKGFWDAEPFFLDGAVADVRIYDRALSADDAFALFLAPVRDATGGGG